jgi:hypothetical protein
MRLLYALCCATLFPFLLFSQKNIHTQVLVIGGGTGGVAAGIQSVRMQVATIIAEPTPWLGGMLTAAGVSATDGNHRMPAGIWGEFRERLRKHYGGAAALETGWVSNTHFEPHIGAAVFKEMADEQPLLNVWFKTIFQKATKTKKGWKVTLLRDGKAVTVHCNILVDATDLGDVAAAVGADYDLGMDSRTQTGELIAAEQGNNIVQDLTWCAILKDFGKGSDHTIPRPPNYDPQLYHCACEHHCKGARVLPCPQMLSYAKLPNDKYLINWPRMGNDFYANLAILNQKEKEIAENEAKNQTLGFIYFIQNELGFRHLGLANDEFPTDDKLALIPYHREGRRVMGLVQLNINHILVPYEQQQPLYRTGIAVGDYPIDHHHDKNMAAPNIEFPPIPSFNIPVGCLIPCNTDHFLIADKAISVTNIVNGASRLQPVVLQIGQAAGIMAAMSATAQKSPRNLSVRAIQAAVLDAKGYLMPYVDVPPTHPFSRAIQQISATGLLRGVGEPHEWANRTWFYPDSTILANVLVNDMKIVFPNKKFPEFPNNRVLTNNDLTNILIYSTNKGLRVEIEEDRPLLRGELADLLWKYLGAEAWREVGFDGNFK